MKLFDTIFITIVVAIAYLRGKAINALCTAPPSTSTTTTTTVTISTTSTVTTTTTTSTSTTSTEEPCIKANGCLDRASLIAAYNPLSTTDIDWTDKSITVIKPGIFNDFSVLRSMSLRFQLHTIKANTFLGTTVVTELNCADNQISYLDPDAFAGLIKLEILNLAYNKLTDLSPDVLSPFKLTLIAIELTHNSFTTLNFNLIQGMSSLTAIYLMENPLPVGFTLNTTGLNPVPLVRLV